MIKFIIIHLITGCIGLVANSPIISTPIGAAKSEFRYVYLKHINTFTAIPLLKGICQSCDWVVGHQHQSLGVRAGKSQWQQLKKAIQRIDKPTPQIGLSIEVVEVSNLQSARYQQLLSQLTEPLQMNQKISTMLQLMVSSGNASVVSSPQLVGVAGKPIILHVGERIPYTNSVDSGNFRTTQLNYIDTGIKLTVTPYKHYGQAVDLVIELSYNTISGYRSEMGMDLPIVASRQSSVTATTKLGNALVFAGLLDQSQHVSIEKVPLLGDLPWIGGLFQRQVSQKKSTDVIYKITPHLIR
ncbi:MAG: type II secretion system protein GspD [Candidatus Marinamargulisbacteria bacterium]